MKGLAVVNGFYLNDSVKYVYDRLKEELSYLGVGLDMAKTTEIFAKISENTIKTPLNYDFIVFLDKDLYTSFSLEKTEIRMFNTARSIWLCDDKMLTHITLANKGIKMPNTIAVPLNYSDNINPKFLDKVIEELGLPLVAKKCFGSCGSSVVLIKDRQSLIEWENANKNEPHLYQEFIDSSFGYDYRLIVVGGHYVAGMKRNGIEGDFRSNIALGGHGEAVEMPKDYIKMAETSAKELGLDYCGVDILSGPKGEPILCEINSNAFMTGIEKITGVNVAGAFAKHIVDSLNSDEN